MTGCGPAGGRRRARDHWKRTTPTLSPARRRPCSQERANELSRALSSLSRRDYLLFYRKYYYLQSTAQIAAELGVTERAVEGRLYRLRKKLQHLLGGEL